MKPNNSLPIKLEPVKVLQRGDVFLWKSGMTGKYEIHTFHSDAGYGAKTFTDYNEQDGSSLLVNYSGVCGVLSCDENQAEDFWKKNLNKQNLNDEKLLKKEVGKNKEMKTKQKKTNSKVDSHKIDKDILLTKDFIKQYLKENLSISVDSDTNDFMSTDASTRTRVTATLILEDEEISSDSYTV